MGQRSTSPVIEKRTSELLYVYITHEPASKQASKQTSKQASKQSKHTLSQVALLSLNIRRVGWQTVSQRIDVCLPSFGVGSRVSRSSAPKRPNRLSMSECPLLGSVCATQMQSTSFSAEKSKCMSHLCVFLGTLPPLKKRKKDMEVVLLMSV